MSHAALLEAHSITAWRGETCVLNAESFTLAKGEVKQVTGPNGSGKTTLLRIVAGLSLPDDGVVLWQGNPIDSVRSEYHAQLLFLGHKAGISGALTPRENLAALAAFLQLRQRTPNLAALDAVLAELGLGARLDLPCRWLSAGQQRRVALARLVLEPAVVWILDEPLNALDTAGVEWVVSRIQAHAEAGGSVIFTTHQAMQMQRISPTELALASQGVEASA